MKTAAPMAALVFLLCAATPPARADYPPELDRGLRLDLSKDGSRHIRLMTWAQFWARYDQYNPGSMVGGRVPGDGLDFGVRRARSLLYGQVSRDLLFLFHFGIDNQSTVGGGFGTGDTPKKPQLFIHDVWGEYRVYKDILSAGAGLHFWNGVSRQASASTISFLTLDAPIFNWPNLETTDQFGRQLGIYAKGRIEKLEYRVSVNAPFLYAGEPGELRADYANASTKAVQGYFKYDFMEAEPNTLPYYAGTYLGTKRVWNIGAGFYWQPDAMAFLERGERRLADQVFLGLDTFIDLSLGKRAGALTAYAGFLYYDYGPNYLRNIGVINPSTRLAPHSLVSSTNGPGNAVPTMGTGATWHGQIGYLLPDVLGRLGRLQPYAQLRLSTYEALGGPVIVPEGGVNWLLAGQHAKLTLHYRSRPVFGPEAGEGRPVEQLRLSELTGQTQIFF